MTARQPLAAGVIVASLATMVLVGWTFDITAAKSVMAGWRVMVPGTAISFALIGVALILAAGDRRHHLVARAIALLALVVPLLTFLEYVSGMRTGVENWLGARFDPS